MADTATTTAVRTKIKTPSMWKVLFHNDDFTPMEFVVSLLVHVFNKQLDEAEQIMLTVHHEGKAVVGLYTKEIATTKVNQVRQYAQANGHPLLATAEEA